MSNPPEADPAAREALADDDGHLRVIAASSEQDRLLELFQLQDDEGPCMQAFRIRPSRRCIDLHATIER